MLYGIKCFGKFHKYLSIVLHLLKILSPFLKHCNHWAIKGLMQGVSEGSSKLVKKVRY